MNAAIESIAREDEKNVDEGETDISSGLHNRAQLRQALARHKHPTLNTLEHRRVPHRQCQPEGGAECHSDPEKRFPKAPLYSLTAPQTLQTLEISTLPPSERIFFEVSRTF